MSDFEPRRSKKARHSEAASNNNHAVTDRDVNGGLPDRWLYCPPLGKVINGFIPTKTPLDKAYDSLLSVDNYFHPDDILERGAALAGKPGARIGLWINLTKTKRYYNPFDVEARGVRYVWLPLIGHGQSPTEEETEKFINIVREFRRANPDDLIVVHCTHGFNRTGFLIAAYVIDDEGTDVEIAVKQFAAARPDGIYKADYLRDLAERYGCGTELTCPGRPSWEDERYILEQNPQSGQLGGKGKSTAVFMDGTVPGVETVQDEALCKELCKICREYCHHGKNEFPGSQPVSLEKSPDNDNLKFLETDPYMVSWKADGVRYLVLIKDEGEVYAFDRDNNVFLIHNLGFRHDRENRPLRNTLVDAEMIIDHHVEGGVKVNTPRLLIYDLIHYEDDDVGLLDFNERFRQINDRIIVPRINAFKVRTLKREKEQISVRRKDFFFIKFTYKLFQPSFTNSISHEVDGLIFQPEKGPYVSGRFDKLLKWKPPEQQTIDFRLQLRTDNTPGSIGGKRALLFVQNAGTLKQYGEMKPLRKLLPYDQKIIECNYVGGTWNLLRERTDKSFPNAYTTAASVWNCIRYPITLRVLLDFINSKVPNWNPLPAQQQAQNGHHHSGHHHQQHPGHSHQNGHHHQQHPAQGQPNGHSHQHSRQHKSGEHQPHTSQHHHQANGRREIPQPNDRSGTPSPQD